MTTRIVFCVLMALLCLPPAVGAQADELRTPLSQCQLTLATGKRDKGFAKLFADLQVVCGGELALCELESEGGLHNLTLLAANRADLGFVSVDTLLDMKSSDESIAALEAVAAVNSSLLHIVVRSAGYPQESDRLLGFLWRPAPKLLQLGKLSELKGLPVAVVGSAQLLVRMLDRKFGLGLSFLDADTDERALDKLRAGEVAAVFSTSGWPHGVFSTLRQDAGFSLAAFDLSPAPPYRLVRRNYANLGLFNQPFLATPNLLVTRPFTTAGEKGKAVSALRACLERNLSVLREGAFQPGWSEIKELNEAYGWPRF